MEPVENNKGMFAFVITTAFAVSTLALANSIVFYVDGRFVLMILNAVLSLTNWNVGFSYVKKYRASKV